MAEQLANLEHREGIKTIELNVSNIPITSGWGQGFQSSTQVYDTGINLTDKKIMMTFVASGGYGAWPLFLSIVDNTKIQVIFCRFSSLASMSGKLYVTISD